MIISDRRQIILETPKTGLNEAYEWQTALKNDGYDVKMTITTTTTTLDAVRFYGTGEKR